jgi:type 1 fimbria pilin
MRFNPKLAAWAFATTATAFSLGALAASVEVKVIGTIIPNACTPTLAGGGTIDYGTHSSTDLSTNDFTLLPEKNVAFTIVCNAPTKVALKAIDNRAGTRVPGAVKKIRPALNEIGAFGLGNASGKNIGVYAMTLAVNDFTADGAQVESTFSKDSGTTWLNSSSGGIANDGSVLMSWSATTAGAPIAFKTLSGTLNVQAALNKGSELDLSSDVSLDGSATLELVYL